VSVFIKNIKAIKPFLFLLLLFCTSCTKELDLPYPQPYEQIVLNGILHPDSIINVSLTKTIPLKNAGNKFPWIENATVRLYENDELLGDLAFQDSIYTLNYYPKAEYEYRIEVDVPDYPLVSASDVVPALPNATACIRPDTSYVWGNASLHIDIQDKAHEPNFYWFYTTNTTHIFKECEYIDRDLVCTDISPYEVIVSKENYYQSFSFIPDRFNAFIDNTSGGITEYELYIRVDDVSLDGLPITFDIASYLPNQDHYNRYERYRKLYVLNASQHYDRYLKSSITYFLNKDYNEDEDIGFKPFVESSEVYSNVINGTGIFAAYNSVSIPIEDNPCE